LNKKVLIQITTGDCYDKSVTDKGGKPFTSVDYGCRLDGCAGQYGGASPCNNEEQVQRAVKNARETINQEGDIVVFEDLRVRQTGLMCYAN